MGSPQARQHKDPLPYKLSLKTLKDSVEEHNFRHKSSGKGSDAECTYPSKTSTVSMNMPFTRFPEERLLKKKTNRELEIGKRSCSDGAHRIMSGKDTMTEEQTDNEYCLTDGDLVVTSKMIEAFQRDGYVIIRQLLDSEEVALVIKVLEISDIKKHEYGRPDKDGREPKLILWQHPGNDVTGMVARCEKVATTCEKFRDINKQLLYNELLGGEVYHYHTKLNSKEPKIGGKFEWHQDYGYWYKYGCIFPDMMTTFIALDDCNRENGCLQLLKGSHQYGRINHTIVGDQTGADAERVERIKDKCESVFAELKTGDALLFHCNVLHTSSANNSDTWRRALLVAYNRATNNPVQAIKHPGYTPLRKVPNSAIKACTNFTDFCGKMFFKKEPQI